MFYPEYILLVVIIVTFILHLQIRDIYSFFLYNTSPIVFGFLSLYSIYDITNETSINNIILFIMNNKSGMVDMVALYLFVFALCVAIMCYNFYVVYKDSQSKK